MLAARAPQRRVSGPVGAGEIHSGGTGAFLTASRQPRGDILDAGENAKKKLLF